MNHQTILLRIIEEEIEQFLHEQVAPPAAAPASPPATPDAAPAEEANAEEDKDPVAEKIKALASKTAIDIKKTLLSDLQNGGKRKDAEAVIAYVEEKEKDSNQADTEEEVPPNLEKAVEHIRKTFKFKVPEKPEETTPETTTPSAPVAESRLQTTLREYLHYKRLYNKQTKSGRV